MENDGGDATLGIAVEEHAGEAAGGVKELGGGLGEDFLSFALLVAQVEGFALALDGVGDIVGGVAVLADEGIELGGGELDFGWVQGDDEALGEGANRGVCRASDGSSRENFADGDALGVEMEGEQPAGQFGFVEGAGPAVMLEALEYP